MAPADLGCNHIEGLVGLPLFQLLANAQDDAEALLQAVLRLLRHKLRPSTAVHVTQGLHQMRHAFAMGSPMANQLMSLSQVPHAASHAHGAACNCGVCACVLASLVSCMSERLSECPRMTHSRPKSFRISALHAQIVS